MIKIWAADKAFADAIKLSTGYQCQRCGVIYGPRHRGLHLSHYISRGNWSVRFHPDNGWAHCYGCHAWIGARPAEFTAWVRAKLGDTAYEMLMEASRDTSIGRRARREKKEIAKHYRAQVEMMQDRRGKGEIANFMVVGYE